MTRFYCLIVVKLKRSPWKFESDINAQKTGNSAFFRSKFCGKWRIPRCGVKIRMSHNTAGPGNDKNIHQTESLSSVHLSNTMYVLCSNTWYDLSWGSALAVDTLCDRFSVRLTGISLAKLQSQLSKQHNMLEFIDVFGSFWWQLISKSWQYCSLWINDW